MAAFAVVLSGCDLEVLNPGAIQDGDLNTPELMPVLVAGVSAEYNDVQDNYAFDIARLTDEAAGTGSYGSTQDFRTGFYTDQDAEGDWEQMHEAAWAADQAWTRLQEVLEGAESTSANGARLFVYRGHAFMRLGEAYCNVAFDVGPSEPRSAAFARAEGAFNQALTIATAANSTQWRLAALMGLAQAEFGKAVEGTGSWAAASGAAQTAISAITAAGEDRAMLTTRSMPRVRTRTSSGRRRGVAPRSACTVRLLRPCMKVLTLIPVPRSRSAVSGMIWLRHIRTTFRVA